MTGRVVFDVVTTFQGDVITLKPITTTITAITKTGINSTRFIRGTTADHRHSLLACYCKVLLGEFLSLKPWKVYPPEKPYGSLDALLKAEIGVDVKESLEAAKLRQNGGDRRSERFQRSGGTLKRGTTGADYLTARIARDHPDILRRMKAGEFSSVRQAAKEAGLVEERFGCDLELSARMGVM